MAIIFSGDIGVTDDTFGDMSRGLQAEFKRISSGLSNSYSRLTSGSFKLAPNAAVKETSYVDDGFQNVPGTAFSGSGNISDIDDVKTRRITTQSPHATVYIKKKLFWSLRNEHDTKFMDQGEKLFIRASKMMFERKCSQIAAYEALTKLENLVEEESELDVDRIKTVKEILESSIGGFVDNVKEDALSVANNPLLSPKFKKEVVSAIGNIKEKLNLIVKELEKLIGLARQSRQAVHTSWVVEEKANIDPADVGRGVGVIELTLIDSVRTNLSLESGSLGGVSFTAQDPYNLMRITNNDIELALSSANKNRVISSDKDLRGPQEILQLARDSEQELRSLRKSSIGFSTSVSPNNPLGNSDLSEIIFEINPSSKAYSKVTGRFSSLPQTFTRESFGFVLAQLPIDQQLSFSELNLVENIFELLDKYVDAVNNISTVNTQGDTDENASYARRQLRKHYLGKSIVQPMDGIHIYMRSNTFRDSELIGPLNAFLSNGSPFVRSFSGISDGANDAVLQEEMRQFGLENISVDLYRTIRTGSLLRNAGTHVFGGLVSSVSSSFNDGRYTLDVSGESTMKWLNLSRVNVAPSLDQPRGVLEDPLTPLEIKTDEATGLIEGTPDLSTENKKRLLFYKDGEFAGSRVNELNIKQDFKIIGDKAHVVRQHAPGLVYKWKEGVISATQQASLRTSLRGGTPEIQKLRRDVGITVVKDPFANIDVADAISLLVTGFPHNYESFFLNAKSVGNFVPGQTDNDPDSFFHSFFDITRSTNRALGNFQPVKEINITREQMAERLKIQTDLVRENNEIKQLQSEIAKTQDKVNQLPPDASTAINNYKIILDKNKSLLREKTTNFNKTLKDNKNYKVYADDIIFDDDSTGESDSQKASETGVKAKLRSKLIKMRPQLATKLNTDNNLFIVSDEYDKDLDVQAFIAEFGSGETPIWNSQYKQPREICVNAANVIDFEFFADTQGNIQFRAPQYNKVPISLLVKMLLLSQSKGIELMPKFVKSLFKTRRESLDKTAKILDKEIKITNLYLFGTQEGRGAITNRGDDKTSFSSDSGVLLTELDVEIGSIISNQPQQIQSLKNELLSESGTSSVADNSEEFSEIEKEVRELNDPSTPNVNTRRTNLFNKLIQLYSQKQRIEETISKINSQKVSEEEFNDLLFNDNNGIATNVGTTLLPGQISSILEPFGNLLEDDYNDFLGPGSSKRFIIYDDQIINYTFNENDKNIFCRVDVTGQQDLIGEGPGTLGKIPILWAGATDFDLWKQYGWRAQPSVNKPYFKNAELQCAPYALMLLSRQRKDIIRATITVAGNEYYQLGDVVYINSNDLLYYVYGISHNFSYSGQFTTTLDLRYGHTLGDYIPTPLDVIGKNIIQNQRKFNTTFMHRSTANEKIGRCTGVILFRQQEESTVPKDILKDMLEGDIGRYNLRQLKNSILRINTQKNKEKFKEVDIRGFITDKKQNEKITKVYNRMLAVKSWLNQPIAGFEPDGETPIPLEQSDFVPINSNIIREFFEPIYLPTDPDVKLDEANVKRTPSEESYNLASIAPDSVDREFNTVEIVITFED